MSVRILAYECLHCNKIFRTRNIADRHEDACLKNPESRNCLLCKNAYVSIEQRRRCKVTGKRCSKSTSAYCEFFDRREDADEIISNISNGTYPPMS